ncbi:RNA-directed DNA polymerase, eukaryota [Tanacetum coccineum]
MIRRRTSRFAVKSVPDEKDVQSHDEPVRQEDYDVMIELETEDMERLQARLQRHKQDYFENEQQRKHEQEESHEDELWENEQEEESHEDELWENEQEESHEDELWENEQQEQEESHEDELWDYFENEQQRKQEQEEKQILTDYDEPISQEDYDTANVSLSLGQGCADDSVGPSIEVNSNLVPNGPPSSMTFNQAQVACLVGLVEPIENPVLNGAQTANDNHSKCEKRGKSKPRKKNLVVDGASCPPPLVSHSDDADAGFVGFVDEECAMKIIGEHIGFSFRPQVGSMDQSRSWSGIRNLIEKDSPMFLGVQETKIESFDPSFIRSLWPHSDVEFHFSSAIGASVSVKVGLINVYAPQASSQKAALWASIESLINSMEAIWVIYGDFNAVRNSDERLGSHFDEGEANAFNDFISRAGYLIASWRLELHKWIGDAGFLVVISNAWASNFGHVTPDLKLKNKLKSLRLAIKSWTSSQIMTQKQVKEDLLRIHVDGIWCESPDLIKEAVVRHFSSRFQEDNKSRPTFNSSLFTFNSSLFRRVSVTDVNLLEANITMEMIKSAVWDCDGSKAPGPDGFNFKFIKSYWEIVKYDFLDCVKYFEATGKLANGCNPSFIVLIPKKADPLGFSDYRPISLIGCVYKVISKILASRLAKVIPSIIGPNQTAFIEGRQILDGCLVANEILRMANIEDLNLMIFKVDFEGFGEKWRKWMGACLASASISFMVNGSPSKEFKMERGLRQGDPLSPFLFLIVVEALQIAVLEACSKGVYKGITLADGGANLSLLQYADDALFIGEWSR